MRVLFSIIVYNIYLIQFWILLTNRFPKNPIARNKWIKACDLSLSDDLTYIYVCSVHFNAKDIDRGNECQTRCILRTGAVPSIGVPNQICSKKENLDILNDGTENNAKMQLSTHASDEGNKCKYWYYHFLHIRAQDIF